MYLLDTNVVSELRKASKGTANPGVVAWAQAVPTSSLFISAITLMELELGVLLKERQDPAQGAVFRAWLDTHVVPAFAGRVLPIDDRVAVKCAALHAANPKPARDSLIAATALVHGMTVVTRNIADFEPMGVPLLNPWA